MTVALPPVGTTMQADTTDIQLRAFFLRTKSKETKLFEINNQAIAIMYEPNHYQVGFTFYPKAGAHVAVCAESDISDDVMSKVKDAVRAYTSLSFSNVGKVEYINSKIEGKRLFDFLGLV